MLLLLLLVILFIACYYVVAVFGFVDGVVVGMYVKVICDIIVDCIGVDDVRGVVVVAGVGVCLLWLCCCCCVWYAWCLCARAVLMLLCVGNNCIDIVVVGCDVRVDVGVGDGVDFAVVDCCQHTITSTPP